MMDGNDVTPTFHGVDGQIPTRDHFLAADPFPHAVLRAAGLDLHRCAAEFPADDWPHWRRLGDAYQAGKSICDDITVMPQSLQALIRRLNEPQFLGWLTALTGIEALIPDPHLVGGGLHRSGAGGILAPHTDFHLHPKLALYRRLNVLVYLNEEWEQAWGGCLELYAPGASTSTTTVVPRLGSVVVFQTDDRSVHGFPNPIVQGRYRKSVALYYYSAAETASFAGDRTTHWRSHNGHTGIARVRMGAYRGLLLGSRALSKAAHVANPDVPSRVDPDEGAQT